MSASRCFASRVKPSKQVMVTMPVDLYTVIQAMAAKEERANGGLPRVNRVVVRLLADSLSLHLTATQQAAVRDYLAAL